MGKFASLVTILLAIGAVDVVQSEALAQSNAKVKKDLSSVIALQGKPCGRVVEAKKRGKNDYDVKCSDGQKYRVFVDESKRVKVQSR